MQRNLQNAVDRIKAASGVDFDPHDLRRTAASHMTKHGIRRDIVKRILNHADHDVTAVYDRYSYDAEKRAALTAWADIIDRIVTDDATAQVLAFRVG